MLLNDGWAGSPLRGPPPLLCACIVAGRLYSWPWEWQVDSRGIAEGKGRHNGGSRIGRKVRRGGSFRGNLTGAGSCRRVLAKGDEVRES